MIYCSSIRKQLLNGKPGKPQVTSSLITFKRRREKKNRFASVLASLFYSPFVQSNGKLIIPVQQTNNKSIYKFASHILFPFSGLVLYSSSRKQLMIEYKPSFSKCSFFPFYNANVLCNKRV